MANRFDNVAKALATGMPRRKVLKILVSGAAVAATSTVVDKDSVARAQSDDWCFDPTVNALVPCVNVIYPDINHTLPEINTHHPDVNLVTPRRIWPTFNLPVPSFTIPGLNQADPPVINIPVPHIPSPDVNQTIPPVIVPPKLDLLPRIFPQINWNFIPFNPTRRK